MPATPRPALYGIPYPGTPAQEQDIKKSGFTTAVCWAMHVNQQGDIYYNDTPIVTNGKYVGDPGWPGFLKGLKSAPLDRVLFSIGGWQVGDFPNIQALIKKYGIGSANPLYKNLAELRAKIPVIDGFDYDDETLYDQSTTVQLSQMAAQIGYKQITFCPYGNEGFWVGCLKALQQSNPGLVVGFNLQCYAGGSGQDPKQWIKAVTGIPGIDAKAFIYPGLWCCHQATCAGNDPNSACPTSIKSFFAGWKPDGIPGGFIWVYGDIEKWLNKTNCSPAPTTAAYANAIIAGLS
jgi:hypothetical protein